MKTTIDLPDDLYRRVKAKSALMGKRIRDLTIELYERWLAEPIPKETGDGGAWLEAWLRMADEAAAKAPSGPTARELLEEGRGRLEHRG
jgi:hypothetical protein